MDAKLAPHAAVLADLLHQYYDSQELSRLGEAFGLGIHFDPYRNRRDDCLRIACDLIEQVGSGNHYALLTTLLSQIDVRIERGLHSGHWETRAVHERMLTPLQELKGILNSSDAPGEIALPAGTPFSAKSKIRELLATAITEVLVVDPYIGLATLDCLREVRTPIRLLTAKGSQSIESGFAQHVSLFLGEGFSIEVRQSDGLHDRHLVFNDRCWLIGSSLKDAGRKEFHCVEVVEFKADIVKHLEAKWQGGGVLH